MPSKTEKKIPEKSEHLSNELHELDELVLDGDYNRLSEELAYIKDWLLDRSAEKNFYDMLILSEAAIKKREEIQEKITSSFYIEEISRADSADRVNNLVGEAIIDLARQIINIDNLRVIKDFAEKRLSVLNR